ncbi:acyl-CoA dehydrogenase/oxidase C-terminal [Baffinella frigidus]|nr:acyl-CoA dehydrogenase/oxidase C-terminal [Cryptophyta sp. CCMP2293]
MCTDGIEESRKCCGGHGYLLSSGIPELLGYALQHCTAEGDNYVMAQQASRFLLKTLSLPPKKQSMLKGPPEAC